MRLSIEKVTEYRTLAGVQILLKYRPLALTCIVLLTLITVCNAGAPMSDLAEFSRFKKLSLAELATGAVAAERRPEVNMETGLAAEACFIVRQPINVTLKRIERWNAVGHPNLDVLSHGRVSAKLSSDAFESIDVPKSEGASMIALLTRQAQAFQKRGMSGIEASRSNGSSLSPANALRGLLSQLKQWSQYFQPVLEKGGVRRAPPEHYGYWEQVAVEGKMAIVLGSFTSTPAKGGFQALDLQYFATSGFSVAATFYQLWPVRIGNTEATLVWRCSMVSTPRIRELRGVERRAAGVAFKNRVKKYAEVIASDLE